MQEQPYLFTRIIAVWIHLANSHPARYFEWRVEPKVRFRIGNGRGVRTVSQFVTDVGREAWLGAGAINDGRACRPFRARGG